MNRMRKTYRNKAWASYAGNSSQIQEHDEGCDDDGTACLCCDRLDMGWTSYATPRLRAFLDGTEPGYARWPAMTRKAVIQGIDRRYVLYALDFLLSFPAS
jgi:hypothetical protein